MLKAPKVLFSGDHQKIKEWRIKQMANNKGFLLRAGLFGLPMRQASSGLYFRSKLRGFSARGGSALGGKPYVICARSEIQKFRF